jgi:hypothetical protein
MALVLSFWMQKKIDAWKCTRNRADSGIKVVKWDGMREEDALWEHPLLAWGFTCWLEAEADLKINSS